MKILFLTDNFPPEKNATASRVYERACYWVKWGHQVTVITCAPNFPDGRLYAGYENRWRQVSELNGIRVVRVKTFIAPNAGRVLRILDFLSYMVTAFFAGLLERGPEVIVATSPQFFTAVGACALSLLRRLPFVLEISDLWPESIVAVGEMRPGTVIRCLETVEMFLYRRATRVVTLTSAFKDNLMSRGIPSDKIDIVINGVDLQRYSPRPRDHALACKWGIAEDDLIVGYIGTLGMAHALQNVLRAAALVSDRQVRFIFVGSGAERSRLIAESERMSLKNVTFVPAQPKELMPNAWSLCNIALVHLKNAPLFRTVIPSKIFEAMGMGLPILLVAPGGEASHIVRREEVGLCIPPEDPKELASAVLFLKENRQLLDQLSRRSREAAPRYTRERQARDMLVTLHASLTGKPAVGVGKRFSFLGIRSLFSACSRASNGAPALGTYPMKPNSFPWSDSIKHTFDLVVSSLGLIMTSPFLGAIALAVKLSSPGPVFYRGVRVGLNGELFRIFKFRTMTADAESRGGSCTPEEDPRLTVTGRFLRRYKLDELPQLFDVLRGKMSLVGPRPEVQKYVDTYSEEERVILQMRPGITDWASIWNCNEAIVLEGSPEPEKTYEELIRPTKLALQLQYVRYHSFSIDLRILFHTALKLATENWVPKEIAPYGKVGLYKTISQTAAQKTIPARAKSPDAQAMN